jgi:hypothetical protein
MKIVIDIDEDDYNYVKRQVADGITNPLKICIANGMPLPKGHGRLLDEKEILASEDHDGGWYDLVDMPEYIAGVPAIIEEDKESCDNCKHNTD